MDNNARGMNIDLSFDNVVNMSDNEFDGMVQNAQVLGRRALLNVLSGEISDRDQEAGYPTSIAMSDYYSMYERNAIAGRVVEVFPEECWKVLPQVYETDDKEEETAFEKSWKNLTVASNRNSKFKNKKFSNPVWSYCKRLDILSGIGHYGVMLIGFDDGEDLEKPVTKKEGLKVNFLRVFSEKESQISSYVTDTKSERWGFPEYYNIEFGSIDDHQSTPAQGVQEVTKKVHWSRIIHVADNLGSNEIFGKPRQKVVWKRLLDIKKTYGGSSEMYWRGAFPGISIETHPQLGASAIIDTEGLKENLKLYAERLQRFLTLSGASAKSLAPQVVNPTPHLDANIHAICIKLGVPKRVFTGSEAGELASNQDHEIWNGRLAARQNDHLTSNMICPLIDRLIEYGVLEEPKEEYFIKWPDLNNLTKDDQAGIASKNIHAITKYAAGEVQPFMSVEDFYTYVMGFSEEEAHQIAERAAKAYDKSEQLDLDRKILEAQAIAKFKKGMDLNDPFNTGIDDGLDDNIKGIEEKSKEEEEKESKEAVRRKREVTKDGVDRQTVGLVVEDVL